MLYTDKEAVAVFVKDLSVVMLLDFYGDVLSPRSRDILYQYYDRDYSLSEIAESEGVSRQGIRHILKKGEEELRFLEDKLGLAANYLLLKDAAERLRAAAERLRALPSPKEAETLAAEALSCAEIILSKE